MKKNPFLISVGLLSLLAFISSAYGERKPDLRDGTFLQDIGTLFNETDGIPSIAAYSIAVSNDGSVYAGMDDGLFVYRENRWTKIEGIPSAPVSCLAIHYDAVFALVENALYEITRDSTRRTADIPLKDIHDIVTYGNRIFAASSDGLFVWDGNRFSPITELNYLLEQDKTVHAIAFSNNRSIAIAAESGLYFQKPDQSWTALYPQTPDNRSWAPRTVRAVAFDFQGRLWFASPQGAGCYDGLEWKLYTGQEGLPYNDFTCVKSGESGDVWFGTRIGAIRFDGKNWAYRQGRRWLPHDTIHDMAIDSKGNVWLATPAGVGCIERRAMTLRDKAAFYEDEIEKYIKRTEFGYLSEVGLKKPGDKSEIIYSDSDNDGLWTSMYGAGECYAYAATKDPAAKRRAEQAFEALRFLSIAPIGGEVEQQAGFVARTILPTTEPDPNQRDSYTREGMQRRRDSEDRRWKVYFPRWPLTQDKKYWYKTDTSSDELDGHFFFYPLYYDLVADTFEEKERVREIVRNIIDHLIRNDFCLIDHDGTPTRWAVFSPASLNQDFAWYAERGLNSLSILSYLAVAEHITGDPRYGETANELIEKHSFNINAMIPKLQRGMGSGNQSDDEMAFMSFYNLIKYTKNDTLRGQMLFSFNNYWVLEFPEMNPFFNYAYAACAMGKTFTDPWGTYDLSPWN